MSTRNLFYPKRRNNCANMLGRHRFHTRFNTFSNFTDRVSLRTDSSTSDSSDRRQVTRNAFLMFERQHRLNSQLPTVTTAEISAHLSRLSSKDNDIVLDSLRWINEQLNPQTSSSQSLSSPKLLIEKFSQFDFAPILTALFNHPHLPIVQNALDCLSSYGLQSLAVN